MATLTISQESYLKEENMVTEPNGHKISETSETKTTEMVTPRKPRNFMPKKKTPYQGRKKTFGYFYCRRCKISWHSAHSWANTAQMCENCVMMIYPYRQFCLEDFKANIEDEKPHSISNCQMCKRLDGDCTLIGQVSSELVLTKKNLKYEKKTETNAASSEDVHETAPVVKSPEKKKKIFRKFAKKSPKPLEIPITKFGFWLLAKDDPSKLLSKMLPNLSLGDTIQP